MLDWLAARFSVSPTPNQLKHWVSTPFIPPNSPEREKYFQNRLIHGTVFKFTYYPPNQKYPSPHFRVEFSPSTLLYGNNVQLIEDQSQIDEVRNLANVYLSIISWIPPVDIGDGILSRVDATYNYPAGDRVHDYIRALSNLEDDYPQRETRPWKYGGVQFYSKATTTTFYDLLKKHQIPAAYGYLRQETSMRGSRNIAQRMGIDNPTIRQLNIDWLADTLRKDLQVLHLDQAVICDRDLASEILLNHYKSKRASGLYGYLILRQSMTRAQLISRGVSERTLQGWDKAIHDAGVALTMTDKASLPPLWIGDKAQEIAGGTQ
jgi:hypothetical protein